MRFFLILFLIAFSGNLFAQNDTLIISQKTESKLDKRLRESMEDSLQKATIRRTVLHSAIVPGWGQIDNKKVWKVPIIYGALGTTAYLFFRNLTQYRQSRDAYRLATDTDTSNDILMHKTYYPFRTRPQVISSFRNGVRQNVDYCALFFLGFWALNVADAAVDANLKYFDVSDDISLKIKAGYSPTANTVGLMARFNIKDKYSSAK